MIYRVYPAILSILLLLSSAATFAMESTDSSAPGNAALAKNTSVGTMISDWENELKEKKEARIKASQQEPSSSTLSNQSSSELNTLLEECEQLILSPQSDTLTRPSIDTTSQNNDNTKKFSSEFNIYLMNNGNLTDQEKGYLFDLTQRASADTSFDTIVRTFKNHQQCAAEHKKPINELTEIDMLKALPTVDTSDQTPTAQPTISKKTIGACLGISVAALIAGYSIYKFTSYVRKKIKSHRYQTTVQVSAITVPASIAIEDQAPALKKAPQDLS